MAAVNLMSLPYSLAFALTRAAFLHFLRHEVQASQEHVKVLITLATEQEFPDVLALETARQGAGLVEQGDIEAGIAQLQQGLAGMQRLGQEIGRSFFLACLAKAYGKRGQTDEALIVMTEALAAVDRTEEHCHAVELYRLKGELLLAQENNGQRAKSKEQKSHKLNPQSQILNPESEAEACFLKAIDIAQKQQAKSLELRATMSLARLWQQQALEQGAESTEHRAGKKKQGARDTHHVTRNKRKEAHRMLLEIYEWFTEGFDTKDLQEATALIEELNQ